MAGIKIRFFSPSLKEKRASHRLRGIVTSNALSEAGYDSKILDDWEEIDSNTIVIFLKFSQPEDILKAKSLGAFTAYDLCDNKFDEKEEYKPCCLAADMVTVNSEQMGISVNKNTGRNYIVMPDPYERPKLQARFNPGETIKLLWFGSQASLKFLPMVEIWQRLEQEIKNYRFTMILQKPERLQNKMKERARRNAITGVDFNKIDMLEWSWELQGRLLEETDIVLMPVQTDNPRTDTKSANRLIDSLISGRFVITTPLASYLEFSPYSWQEDYIAGIKWALEHPGKTLNKIIQGQEYTERNFSAKKLAIELIEKLITIKKGYSDVK